MSKPRRLFLATFCCALLASIAWLALREEEPHYQGKPLSYWLQAYEDADPYRYTTMQGRDENLQKKIRAAYANLEAAMQAVGTNSIPLLLRYLRASDDTWSSKLRQLASKQKLVPVDYTPADSLVNQGALGVELLGESAGAMVPELLRIYEERPSSDTRYAVISSLGSIGKGADSAIPLLVRAYQNDSTPANRFSVIGAFAKIHARPDVVVPLLTDALAMENDAVRYRALSALGQFGSDAKAAIPAIERLEKIDPEMWRERCTNTLRQILSPASTP